MKTLIPSNQQNLATVDLSQALADNLTIGEVANRVASQHVFTDYIERKAANSQRRYKADLTLFADYLAEVGAPVTGDLATEPIAWAGVTWGLVEGFKRWLLSAGYSIASANARLSTVKNYSALASKAGVIGDAEARLIASVGGYSHKDGKHIDEARETSRIGHKKAAWVVLSKEQAAMLKAQPDTPQGRRDSLLMCLLLDHGLRCGEVAALEVSALDLQGGLMTFYRQKVDKVQTHRLTADTLTAARAYFANDALWPNFGPKSGDILTC
jgi:integrase